MIFSLPLNKPLNLKRRKLVSEDPNWYMGEMLEVSNPLGQTGYGEVVGSPKLAREVAELHLALLETGFQLDFCHSEIPIAAMLESIDLEAATQFVRQGFTTLKFKVGRDCEKEAEQLQEIRAHLGPGIDIRLDANRAFSLEQAIGFGRKISGLRIAYFEEPLQDYRQIPEFFRATQIPVALDETLIECEEIPRLEGVSTYALKPFMMPDLASVLRCLSSAHQNKINLAVCSAFENPYSTNWLVLLAALWPGELLPAGLSTIRWYKGYECGPQNSSETARINLLRSQDQVRPLLKSTALI